jgi:hypothetical protein
VLGSEGRVMTSAVLGKQRKEVVQGFTVFDQNFYFNLQRAALGGIFMLIMRGLHVCSAASNLDTNSAFPLGSRKTAENLDQVCWSQDLPDAYRLVASSPAFEFMNPNSTLYWLYFVTFYRFDLH